MGIFIQKLEKSSLRVVKLVNLLREWNIFKLQASLNNTTFDTSLTSVWKYKFENISEWSLIRQKNIQIQRAINNKSK